MIQVVTLDMHLTLCGRSVQKDPFRISLESMTLNYFVLTLNGIFLVVQMDDDIWVWARFSSFQVGNGTWHARSVFYRSHKVIVPHNNL